MGSPSSDGESILSSDDEDKRIRLPSLKYGYRTQRLGWNELVDIIQRYGELDKLSRSVEQQRDYEMYKRDILLQWTSVTEYVLCAKFPDVFKKRFNGQADRYEAHPTLVDAAKSGISMTKLIVNDFPYYMVPGIEHWVLWKVGGVCTESEIAGARSQLMAQFGSSILHWVNPPHLKSLPAIDHVHFLVQHLTRDIQKK